MTYYELHDLARERQREAHQHAARARLVALARCCKPSQLTRLIGTLTAAFKRQPACC